MLFQNRQDNDVHIGSSSTFNLRKSVDNMHGHSLRNIPGGFHYASNIGGRNLNREGIDKLFNLPCKLDTNATNNINSLSAMVKAGFKIFVDTERANNFFVRKHNDIWRFGHNNGLYVFCMNNPWLVQCSLIKLGHTILMDLIHD